MGIPDKISATGGRERIVVEPGGSGMSGGDS